MESDDAHIIPVTLKGANTPESNKGVMIWLPLIDGFQIGLTTNKDWFIVA